jgi:hypothetical protein
MRKTLKFRGLIVAVIFGASIIAGLSFTTMYAAAQNATSGNTKYYKDMSSI